METFHTDYSTLGLLSHTDLSYIQHDPLLKPFMAYPQEMASFPGILENRKKIKTDRDLLLKVLRNQYNTLGIALPDNIEDLLKEDTFTVTTAHQPSLLTGPLYHIYKIASTIHLARQLNQSLSSNKVVPVFVLSGEDHDWEEINHLYLFGRKYQWERSASGPCGRLSTEGLETFLKSVEDVFIHSPHHREIHEMLDECLRKASNYGEFHHLLLHALFNRHGLVILNMDDAELKRAFIPIMEKEMTTRFSSTLVPKTQSALESVGFKPQAFCRPVNLFYMSDQRRERIDLSGDGFVKVESGIQCSETELLGELHDHPERFSPNVILRPLYQEFTLPNLAYVGGGGEIAYWLERKTQFEAAGIHYPMLVRRNSLLMIDRSAVQFMQKSDISRDDILSDSDALVKKYLLSHSQAELDYTVELKMIVDAYQALAVKAEKIDPTLAKAILAEETKQSKIFEQLGSRLLRTEKQHQETDIKRIQKLKEKLFPANGLQERQENFLTFYAEYHDQWLSTLINICDPFNGKFTLLELP